MVLTRFLSNFLGVQMAHGRLAGLMAGMAFILAGCASSDEGLLIPLGRSEVGGKTVTLLAATTRAAAPAESSGHIFGGDRDAPEHINYTLLTLSLPPDRKKGELPVSADKPDPQKHITLVSVHPVDAAGAAAFLRSEALRRPANQRSALVFTHGFNTRFDDAAMRFGQIIADSDFKGVPVLFSWPSRGEVSAYGYDRESANYSRDAFERTLTMVGREKAVSGMMLFAHSMGNWLTMETLRGAVIGNNKAVTDRLNLAVLAAPDVDLDVFRSQIARLGGLQKKFILYASNDDYALRISSKLAGGKLRAGDTTDTAVFEAIGVQAHNLSGVEGGVGKNHGKAFGDSETITSIGGLLSASAGAPPRHAGPNIIADGFTAVGDAVTGVGKVLTNHR